MQLNAVTQASETGRKGSLALYNKISSITFILFTFTVTLWLPSSASTQI